MSPIGTEVSSVKLEIWVTFGDRKFHDIDYTVYLLYYRHFCVEQEVLCILEHAVLLKNRNVYLIIKIPPYMYRITTAVNYTKL